jgi:exodeoxyribonuclease V alpha subunit
MAQRIARLKAPKTPILPALPSPTASIEPTLTPTTIGQSVKEQIASVDAKKELHTGMHGEAITYNHEQAEFIALGKSGQSCVLIGAAGTGKTTCSQGAIEAMLHSGNIPVLQSDGHKHLKAGSPGIIIVAFTRRAVNNSRKVQSEDFKHNCITVHKLLEYQPEYYEIIDPETGMPKKTMSFEPNRNASNPLPSSIHTIIIEEASMLGTSLFLELAAACQHTVQWIFIGDLQQLPPVFGPAILGFKLLELPVVELTEVYRQALESPIIRLAHRVLSGNPIPVEEYASWHVENQLTIHPWKKKLSAEHAALTLSAFFKKAVDSGEYDPDKDMILIPFNVNCGTVEVNNNIANHLARQREAVTFEVMAGFNKFYFSAGDKVLYEKEDAEIVSIEVNPAYSGTRVQKESKFLDYWGHNPNAHKERDDFYDRDSNEDVDFLLDSVAGNTGEDRVTLASHIFVLRLLDTEREISISKASEVNTLLHSYALTVHKSQGSEWRKVFFCLHTSHNSMLARELLYTGITRAREELYVICEPESFTKGIVSQRVKGDTLAEKAEFFKGKQI